MAERIPRTSARRRGAPRSMATGLGLALVVAGLLLAISTVHVGDNHCGRVAWDTNSAAPCTDAMTTRTLLVAVAVVGGTAVVLTALRWRPSAVLIAVALALLSFAGTRLLDPVGSPYCGSVLNRHHTQDDALERACTHALGPKRTSAAASATGGALAAIAAGVVRRRPPRATTTEAAPAPTSGS